LWSAEGKTNTEIASPLKWTKATVGKWRQRFIERRLSGLYDELRPGRPGSVSDEKVALLLRRILKNKPPVGSYLSVRQAASTNDLSRNQRSIASSEPVPFSLTGARNFELSGDPFFIEKVRDVVGSS
jgi:putative transposase